MRKLIIALIAIMLCSFVYAMENTDELQTISDEVVKGLVTFEDSFNDQDGVAPTTISDAVVSAIWSKFGTNSGAGNSAVARGNIVYDDANILPTTNQAYSCWFNKPLEFGDSGKTALRILDLEYTVSGTEYSIYVSVPTH